MVLGHCTAECLGLVFQACRFTIRARLTSCRKGWFPQGVAEINCKICSQMEVVAFKNVTVCILCPCLACTYKSQECRLTIHYEHGFSLTTEPQDGAFSKTIAQYPYEKLKMSSDDGIRMLYLDFGGKDGEIVSTAFSRWIHYHLCGGPYGGRSGKALITNS